MRRELKSSAARLRPRASRERWVRMFAEHRVSLAAGLGMLVSGPLILTTAAVTHAGIGTWPAVGSLMFAWSGTTLAMLMARHWGRFLLFSAPVALGAPLFLGYFVLFQEFPDDNAFIVGLTSSTGDKLGWIELLGLGWWLIAWLGWSLAYLAIALSLRHLPIGMPMRRWTRFGVVATLVVSLLAPVRNATGALTVSLPDSLHHNLTTSYPLGTLITSALSLREAMITTGDIRQRIPYGATYGGAAVDRETHVLVVGESARFDAFSINGYPRPTSVSLSELPLLVSFSSAFAPANLTHLSVPIILSGGERRDVGAKSNRPLIVDAFREAGYRTAWISNQEPYIARMISVAADRWCVPADFARRGWQRTLPDEAVLPCLREEMTREENRKFIVIHTYGSHWNYAHRVPDGHFVFSGLTRDNATRVIADAHDPSHLRRALYDDTIHYTSVLLRHMIDLLQNQPGRSSLTYVSDHGEAFPQSDGYSGHGTPRFSLSEAHVPLFVWANTNLVQDRPERWSAIVGHRHAPLHAESTFHLVASLGGVAIPGIDEHRNPASLKFRPPSDLGNLDFIAGGRTTKLRFATDWRTREINGAPPLRTDRIGSSGSALTSSHEQLIATPISHLSRTMPAPAFLPAERK